MASSDRCDIGDDSRTMSIATTAVTSTILQPSRISSEGPEVVPEQPEPSQHDQYGNEVVVTTYGERDIKRGGATGGSRYQKQVDDRETETRNYPKPPTPSLRRYDWEPTPTTNKNGPTDMAERESEGFSQGRTFGLGLTVLLVAVAFLLGGGIGGGVGGALFAQEKSRVQTLSPTATASSQSSASTIIVDTAGCPLVNNSTYLSSATTPSTSFLKLCGTEISSPAGQSIEIANSTQTSFDACLDSCATYRGCVGATWIIFSPTSPTKNNQCFLKSGIGVETPSSTSGDTSCSGYLKSAVS